MTPSKPMWVLANRLAAFEERHNPDEADKLHFPVTDRLRLHLVTLMGVGGFRALLLRALALAATENPWLLSVQVEPSGALSWSNEKETAPSAKVFSAGRVFLVAELLGLLEAFIGELLILRIIRETWPEVSLKDLDRSDGDKNEKQR